MSQRDNLLGRLALHYELLTRDQLREALRQQSREGHKRRIGEILVERGWITPERFQRLLQIQKEYQAKLDAKEERAGAPAPAQGAGSASVAPTGTEGAPDSAATGGRESVSVVDEIPGEAEDVAATQPIPRLARPTVPAPRDLESLLRVATERHASDLHLHSGVPARLRIHGHLVPLTEEALDADEAERLVLDVLTPDQRRELDAAGQVDLAYGLAGTGRFRTNVYRQQNGLDAVFRVIPEEPPTLTDLGLPLDLARFANYHQGLVLLTGPSGCGKSSTLAALMRIVNEERRDHIVTIEDPIEFVHRPRQCVVNQRQVGRDTQSFSRALRAALREDPDVIVVGELRDLETISLALTAAETGHLVLATLHTMNAINTINRLVGVFPPSQQSQIRTMVSESLRAVISQRLARRRDGAGLVPVLEVLMANRAVSNLIRENKTFQIQSVIQTGSGQGMRFLDASLQELVQEGIIDREEARRLAEDPKRFQEPEPALGDGEAG